MEKSEQLAAAEPTMAAPVPRLGFFHLPAELRVEIFEYTVLSAAKEEPAPPCPHGLGQTGESLPRAVRHARLVGRQFGTEFEAVYYKSNTIILSMGLADLEHISLAGGLISDGRFPIREDYGLMRTVEMDIYIHPDPLTTCRWCYWYKAKQSTVRPLFQQGSERPSCGQMSFPRLESMHLRFINQGQRRNYVRRQTQIGRAIKTLAQAIPAQAKSSVDFYAYQMRRNNRAEQLFRSNYGIQSIKDAAERPLWFQCDPPMKYGGRIQGWIDKEFTWYEILLRVGHMEEVLARECSPAELESLEHRERQLRRLHSGTYEVVVLEMWGGKMLENCLEQGDVLKQGFVRDMEAGLAAREVVG